MKTAKNRQSRMPFSQQLAQYFSRWNRFRFPDVCNEQADRKRDEILEALAKEFVVKDVQDWSEYEVEGRFLEGTGSMVIDYENKMIYACVSERTSLPVLEKYAGTNNFQAIVFLATDKNGDRFIIPM